MAQERTAERVVSLRLTRFWAEETPSYRAQVVVVAEVRDGAGKVL